jgi:hypothetical protein
MMLAAGLLVYQRTVGAADLNRGHIYDDYSNEWPPKSYFDAYDNAYRLHVRDLGIRHTTETTIKNYREGSMGLFNPNYNYVIGEPPVTIPEMSEIRSQQRPVVEIKLSSRAILIAA